MRVTASYALIGLLAMAPSAVHAADPVPLGVDVVAPADGDAVLSGNGRFVAWIARAYPIYELRVKDRNTGQIDGYGVEVVRATDGLPARGLDRLYGISDDGRYVTVTTVFSSTYTSEVTTLRFDRLSGTHLVLGRSPETSPPLDTIGVAMSRDGQVLAWLQAGVYPDVPARVMLWTAADPVKREIGRTCVGSGPYGSTDSCTWGSAVSGDGSFVMYTAGSTTPEALAVYDVSTGKRDYYPQIRPATYRYSAGPTIVTTATGEHVLARRASMPTPLPELGLLDRGRSSVDPLAEAQGYDARAMSDDGLRVLLQGGSAAILDRQSGLIYDLPRTYALGLSGDGRSVLAWYTHEDGSGTDLRAIDLDADADGMLDGWEVRFGLDPTSGVDATADNDGDGMTNVAEFAVRSHPTAVSSATRLFAEGAGGDYFDTTLSVFNPGETARNIVVRFLGAGGTAASRVLRLEAHERADVNSCCIATLDATEFALVVESDGPVVADRRMTWDRATGYGSHATTGVAAPATTWYFAEGATIGGIQTFFLLQNPGDVDGTASVEFLLADGTPVTRSLTVPAQSRRTLWVNQEGGSLAAAEFAAVVRTSVPMVAERAMYRDAEGQMFAAGTDAIGVTSPSTRWLFAEGTTRGTFDTFVLVANPSEAPVTVTARFAGAGDGGTPVSVTRTHVVAPRSRLTIWVDQEDAALAAADVSATLDASAPIVAERAMWWRAGGPEWVEGHVEFGATDTAVRFAIAGGTTIPDSGTDTFVLVGSPDGAAATLRVTAYPAAAPPIVREFETSGSRATIWMRQAFPELTGPYSLIVESLPVSGTPTPIVIEQAVYSRGLTAGSVAHATPLPPP